MESDETKEKKWKKKSYNRELPGGPGVNIWHFHYHGPRGPGAQVWSLVGKLISYKSRGTVDPHTTQKNYNKCP